MSKPTDREQLHGLLSRLVITYRESSPKNVTKPIDIKEAITIIENILNKSYLRGVSAIASAIKQYDWQLEDNINANDVVCEQVNAEVAALITVLGPDKELN